jgi:mutator protein MutT
MGKETDKRAFVALINDAGQVLVIKRAASTNNGGQLGLPGGHLDEGETIEQGARRELREELGVNIDFATRSYIKVHADSKRTILVAQMPPSNAYAFSMDHREVECIYWMRVNEIAGLAVQDRTSEEEAPELHKSLQLALPVLMDLEPKYILSAFARRAP